ncbi:MAG: ATP-binding protein [Desulfitobacteriaceae bacterium]|nr:ATP-binding protein [Desulfitobacteriaceae bacterium]
MDKIGKLLRKNLPLAKETKEETDGTKYRCPLCQDRGIIINDDIAYQCQCVKHRTALKNFLSANVTPVIATYTFDKFQLSYYSPHIQIESGGPTYRALAEGALHGAKEFVARYLEQKNGTGLLLEGNVGSGKTFLAGAIINALIEHEKQVLFLVVPDFLDDLRATYQKQGEFSEAELMDTARKAEVLVLDDLGAHNFSDWTQNKIFSLINYRMNHGLPCVITTNLSIGEMNDVVGLRTVSRIIQMCKIYRLYVDEDIRVVLHRGR